MQTQNLAALPRKNKVCDNIMAENPTIRVRSFGGFSISVDGAQDCVTDAKGHSKKLWSLMQYLIFSGRESVPSRELIELLWPGEGNAADPISSLRLLVHRARAELNKLTPYKGTDLIICHNECYYWNRSYPLDLDTADFEKHSIAARSGSPDEKLEHMLAAIDLYKGRFMPKAAHYPWVQRLASQYHAQYISLCLRSCDLLRRAGRREDIMRVCLAALAVDPARQELHKIYMEALAASGRVPEALAHYARAVALLKSESKTPDEELENTYKTLSGNINNEIGDINSIRGGIEETDMYGAFFCDYELFKNIYRLKARETQRSGEKLALMLFTVMPHSGASIPASGVMERIKELLFSSLRKEDLFSRYSVSQFLILLQGCSENDSSIVFDRINKRFVESESSDDFSIHTSVLPMLPAATPKVLV
jgi:DNA-binding SARP family transcriptional activator